MTPICGYGCESEARFTLKNGMPCCSPHHMQCSAIRQKVGDSNRIALAGRKLSQKHVENIRRGQVAGGNMGVKQRGRTLSPAHRENIRAGLVGRPVSEDTRKKISESNKATRAENPREPWNKGKKTGQAVWNKGKQKRDPLPLIPGDDPIYSDLKKYRNRVSARTRKTYRDHKGEINPLNLPLGKCGVSGAHQIDHIVSVREGFERKIPVEVISAKENLQVIPWLDNIRKYDGTRKQVTP